MTVTRELKVTYGSYVVGDSGDATHVHGKHQLEKSFESGFLEFTFLVSHTTEAGFAAACIAAETAFRKPYQALTVVLGVSTLLSLLPASNTSLDPIATITKRGDDGDTGRSRFYEVRIEFGLPANTGAEAFVGLRSLTVNQAFDPARRRTVSIAGVFTAAGGNGARAQYNSQNAALVASVKSDLGVTDWELAEEPTQQADTNDKLLEFAIVYDELIFSQADSSLDDTQIVRQRLEISAGREEFGDTPVSERLATMNLSYEVWIRSDLTTDIRAKYSAIREWLISQIDTTLGGGAFALVVEEPRFHYDENRITVTMVALGQPAGQVILENRVTTADDDTKGTEIVPAWTGDPLSAYRYAGPRIVVRTVTQTQKRIGTFNEQDALALLSGEAGAARARTPSGAGGGGWSILRENPQATPLRLGVGSDTLDLTEMSLITQMRYTKEPAVSVTSRPGPGGTFETRS